MREGIQKDNEGHLYEDFYRYEKSTNTITCGFTAATSEYTVHNFTITPLNKHGMPLTELDWMELKLSEEFN